MYIKQQSKSNLAAKGIIFYLIIHKLMNKIKFQSLKKWSNGKNQNYRLVKAMQCITELKLSFIQIQCLKKNKSIILKFDL